MRINNNLMAMNTHRQLSINSNNVAKSTEKLSSGRRVNRAGDDAAGLAISEKMRAQIRGLNMASKNSQDAISLLQTAEGALTETHAILQRMRELSVQSSSDTNEATVDRVALNEEFQELSKEIEDIATKTKFNDMELLNGSFGVSVDSTSTIFETAGVVSVTASGAAADTYTFADAGGGGALTVTRGSDGQIVTLAAGGTAADSQTLNIAEFGITVQMNDGYAAAGLDGKVITMGAGSDAQIQTGANNGDKLNITIDNMGTGATGLNISGNGVETRAKAEASITAVNDAINTVSSQRAKLGAMQNRLEHKIKNLDTSSENLGAAESRIRDLDMASEMTKFTSNNILVQAATAMLSQANSAPQSVLQLLK